MTIPISNFYVSTFFYVSLKPKEMFKMIKVISFALHSIQSFAFKISQILSNILSSNVVRICHQRARGKFLDYLRVGEQLPTRVEEKLQTLVSTFKGKGPHEEDDD